MQKIFILSVLFSLFLIISCEKESEEVIHTPTIVFEQPTENTFSIGEEIPVKISITHNEVLDNVKYYEFCNCSDDNYDSVDFIEWENIYELSWYYEKNIETSSFPENIMCSYSIDIEATDLNQIKSQSITTLQVGEIIEAE